MKMSYTIIIVDVENYSTASYDVIELPFHLNKLSKCNLCLVYENEILFLLYDCLDIPSRNVTCLLFQYALED